MYCSKCGKKIPNDSDFCQECGNRVADFYKAALKEPAGKSTGTAGKVSVAGPVAREVPAPKAVPDAKEVPAPKAVPDAKEVPAAQAVLLKTIAISDSKYLKLYKDRLEYHKGTVYYKDIASVAASGSTSKSYGLITHSTFMGELKLLLYNGEKHTIRVGGGAVIGIGNTKSSEAVFQEILDSTYQIIAREVAACLLEQIKRGAEPELGLVTVTKDKMYVRKLIGKSEKVIAKEEFGTCRVKGDIYILDRHGDKLAKIASNMGNAYVLPHLLNALYAH